jgi:putative two-component system response regulator
MLAEIAEYKDKATGGHVNRLDFYTKATAIAMGIEPNQAIIWGKASRLHDVGKVGVPDYILAKPGKLTPEEFEIIKKHTTLGANILGHDSAFELARQIALHHHERWDGKGYPDGVLAKELPLVTRIVSVVDVFDALISWRPYKEPWTVEKARMVITEGAGSQFDPDVVAAFITVLDSGDIDNTIQLAGEAFQ